MVSFGTAVPQYVLTAPRAAGGGGSSSAATSVAAACTLTAALRAAEGPCAVEQEGGDGRIVPWAPPEPSEPAQAAEGTVGRDARRAGLALSRAGINVSLAPVADVPSVAGSALASRSFSTDPKRASTAVAASVAGWRAGGVAATAKHFPGLGAATVNTDDGPVTIRRSRSKLLAGDLPPFEAAIRAGVPLVRVSHARYTALDRSHVASQSRAIIEGSSETSSASVAW